MTTMRAHKARSRPEPVPPPRLLCQRCHLNHASRGELAVHLTKAHGVEPEVAVVEARGWAAPPTTTKKTGTPRGDPAKPCGYCKRPKTDHAATCPFSPGSRVVRPSAPKRVQEPRRGRVEGEDSLLAVQRVYAALRPFS